MSKAIASQQKMSRKRRKRGVPLGSTTRAESRPMPIKPYLRFLFPGSGSIPVTVRTKVRNNTSRGCVRKLHDTFG